MLIGAESQIGSNLQGGDCLVTARLETSQPILKMLLLPLAEWLQLFSGVDLPVLGWPVPLFPVCLMGGFPVGLQPLVVSSIRNLKK